MRLIDADAIEYRESMIDSFYRTTDEIPVLKWVSKKDINNAPTIEAEPVKHGKWILTNKPNIYGGTTIQCSECGYEGVIAHLEDHHYCWYCGAKMNEVNDEL